MKIMYIIKALAMKAGLERVVSDKMNYLAEHGYEVSRGLAGGFSLGRTWSTTNNDAWDGSQSDNSGSSFGSGWTDNGGDAWN